MNRLATLVQHRSIVVAVSVLVGSMLGLATSRVLRPAYSDSGTAPSALAWYVCNPGQHVGVFSDRVHIYCASTTPISGAPALDAAIHWFAVPTSPDSAAASRFMSLAQTGSVAVRPIWLMIDPADTSGSSFGCAAADCRKVYAMEMR